MVGGGIERGSIKGLSSRAEVRDKVRWTCPKMHFVFRVQAQHKGVKIQASRTKRRMVRTSLGWFIAGGSDAIVCSELGFQVERHDVIKLDS